MAYWNQQFSPISWRKGDMHSLRKRFGGLYWRLTGSYFLITLLAAAIVEVAITLPATIQDYQQANDTFTFTQILAYHEAPLLAPFFTQSAPDASALQNAVNQIDEHIAEYFSVKHEPPLLFYLGVLDSRQHVLATDAPCAPESATIAVQIQDCTPQEPNQPMADSFTAPILAVLDGDLRQSHWIAVSAEGILIAVPIHGRIKGDAPVGALVTVMSLRGNVTITATPSRSGVPVLSNAPVPSGISQFLSIFWNHLQVDGLYFILIASVVGTLTGLLITRNVTRRLRRITQAAEAWSKGKFEVAVRDPTRDEIGQLGQDLNGMAEQLHTLMATREELAAVEERNRLARDLHDSIKQNVFATALLIGAARAHLPPDTPGTDPSGPPEAGRWGRATRSGASPMPSLPSESAQTYLAEAEALAEQTRQELTALIRELRPARLEDKGLAVVLRDYAEDWSRRMGIAIAMHVQGERIIALDIEESLFRVAQEALANIAHHSGAAHVTIHLVWDGVQVRLTITDDGAGFDVAHASGRGVGLASMRERVAAHSGTLNIASTAGATTVKATVPLQNAEELSPDTKEL
jgi:signal transduction histidine kinase